MKKIITLFAVVVGLFAFSSCEGPEGPPGFDGQDGLIAEVSELTMDFTGPSYGKTFPLDPEIFLEDNLLIYELVNTNDGIDTWALLPQVYYFTGGTAQYKYTFSYDQFSIFIEASFPLNQLPTSFTTKKTFRIVIVPGSLDGTAKMANKTKEDFSDYNAVIKKYNIDDSNVKKIN